MASSGPPQSQPRGRPVEIDPARVSQVAVSMFVERGYAEVSAADVAVAAGVSRRSLFRYFPTKADLVWDGFHTSLDTLAEALQQGSDLAPSEAVAEAFLVTSTNLRGLDVIRARLRILAAHRELVSVGLGRLDEQIDLCATYLRGRGLEPLVARAQSSALTAATFTGYLHWAAETSDETPTPSVRRALEAVRGL